MSFLVDTNVLSELAHPAPDAGVEAWARQVSKIALSAVTVEEVWFGLRWKPSARVQTWFEELLLRRCVVLPVSEDVAVRSGRLRGELRAKGAVRTQADMLIAATAAIHGLTLVTRNERDFAGCAIAVLNPFTGSP